MLRSLFRNKLAALRGSIDAVHNGQCHGWAMDTKPGKPVEVTVLVDGCVAGYATANRYRADLEKAGLRDGRLAFVVEIPESMRDGRHHRVEARSRDGRAIAVRETMQIVPTLTPAEFDRRAPWIDADDAMFDGTLARLKQDGVVDPETETHLRFFHEHGWLKLEQAVPHALIDKLLADIEAAWEDLPPQRVLANSTTKCNAFEG